MIAIFVIALSCALIGWAIGSSIYRLGYLKGYEDAGDFVLERLRTELEKREP